MPYNTTTISTASLMNCSSISRLADSRQLFVFLLALLAISSLAWLSALALLVIERQHRTLRALGVELSACLLAGSFPSLVMVGIVASGHTSPASCSLRVLCGTFSWQMCLTAVLLKVWKYLILF